MNFRTKDLTILEVENVFLFHSVESKGHSFVKFLHEVVGARFCFLSNEKTISSSKKSKDKMK
jgi:hypothetical protein